MLELVLPARLLPPKFEVVLLPGACGRALSKVDSVPEPVKPDVCPPWALPGTPEETLAVVAASSSNPPGICEEWGSLRPCDPVPVILLPIAEVGCDDELTGSAVRLELKCEPSPVVVRFDERPLVPD